MTIKIEINTFNLKRLFEKDIEVVKTIPCPHCKSDVNLRVCFEYRAFFNVEDCRSCGSELEILNEDDIEWSVDFNIHNDENIVVRKIG